MRSQDEIVARLEWAMKADFFGFCHMDLLTHLDFDHAKEFLEPSRLEEAEKTWTPDPCGEEAIKAKMLEYMPFAWDKANNCRGISAGRSIFHFAHWLWLLGESEALCDELLDYELYGKPQLRAICEHYGWDWEQWDDGHWRNSEMEEGSPPHCAADLPWQN